MTSVRSTTAGARSFAMIALALATNALAGACATEHAGDAPAGEPVVAAQSALTFKTIGSTAPPPPRSAPT